MDGKSPQTTDVCLLGVIMLTTRGFIKGGQGGLVPPPKFATTKTSFLYAVLGPPRPDGVLVAQEAMQEAWREPFEGTVSAEKALQGSETRK